MLPMPMRVLPLLIAALAASCAKHTMVDSELDVFVDEGGLAQKVDADGYPEYTGDDVVSFHGTKHTISIDEHLQPVAMGGKRTMVVADKTTGGSRTFSFNPGTNTLTIADGSNVLTVVQNPDKSYTVNGEAAANGKATIPLLKKSAIYNDTSAWAFAATYARCQTCLENAASKAAISCMNGLDEPPAVCDVLRDFCDCTECDKLGKPDCHKCP